MGRFSPSVTPTGVSPLGTALRSGVQGFFKSKERRRKARLQRQRQERLEEIAEDRRRQREIEMARQGFRPEGATEQTSLEEASTPRPGDPSTPIGDAGVPSRVPEDAGNLAEALRGARGEQQTGPFTPGDVREQMLPAAVAMELERAPDRVPLPSGGSIPRTPPEVRRQRDERAELADLLQEGGFPEPRAEVAARTGSDVLRPEPEPETDPVPSPAQLRLAGATDEEIRAVEGDPEAARSLRDQLVGRRTSGGEEPEPLETEEGNAAFNYFRENPDADLGDAARIFPPLNEAQLADIRQDARDAEETLTQGVKSVADAMEVEPANDAERRVLRQIAQFGSMREWERAMGEAQSKIGNSDLSDEEKQRQMRRLQRLVGAYTDLFRRSRFAPQGGATSPEEQLRRARFDIETPPEPF